jgi:hypothetical protein
MLTNIIDKKLVEKRKNPDEIDDRQVRSQS